MTDTLVTIDRSPLSLGVEATEADVEQYRIRLEDELARALPGLTLRVVLGDSVGYDCTGETLTCEEMKTIGRIWLETAKEFDQSDRYAIVRQTGNHTAVVLARFDSHAEAQEAFDVVAPEAQYPDGGPFLVVDTAKRYPVGSTIPV